MYIMMDLKRKFILPLCIVNLLKMGQQQSGFGGKREDRGGGDADKVADFFILFF